ncbi:MAG: 16S rRNA (cytosine(1402)-N(4))-methyltransferase RsmH [Candidatus Sumerlaeia bacterium]
MWRVHEPVLLKEVLHWLNPQPGETIADLTVGNAGHFLEILRRLDGRGLAIGVDADPEMLEVARRRIEAAGDLPPTPWMLIHSNFSAVDDILRAAGVQALDGVLMDLGLNSMQLQADRGLSHQVDGPLDFRFDRTQGRPAAEWINSAPEEELAQVFRDLGDERRWARAMARAIVRRRAERPIERTLELAAILTRAIPPRWRTTRRPPAARAFLAIRAHINRELPSLKTALEELIPRLAPGGRLLVIAFNGNEDRVVKQAFRRVALSRRELREREAGRGRTGGPAYRLIGTRPIYPSEEEIAANPRARPARLRGLIREKDYDGEKDYEGKD